MIFTTILNNGITEAKNGSPFKPNTMEQGSSLSNSIQYFKDTPQNITKNKTWGNSFSTSQYMNHIKNKEIGISRKPYLLNSGSSNTLSFKNVETNSVKSAIVRTRGSGTVAPKKKGAY